MYRKKNREQLEFKDFYLPFGGKLRSDNRWIRLAEHIPWDELEDRYAALFSEDQGAPAKSFRMALGALIVKERLSITDEETVEQIRENPYLQLFIGKASYQDEAPFDPSLMVHFRKRLSKEIIAEINELIVKDRDGTSGTNTGGASGADGEANENPGTNKGMMMVDATVTPADIAYPTDLNLLNEAREKLEGIIDVLYEPLRNESAKPRTYRQKARWNYLRTAKKKKVTQKGIRKAIGTQLRYVRRDLGHIDALIAHKKEEPLLGLLARRDYRALLVIQELYRQQEKMYREKIHSSEDRIVSIAQPHVRPMVRGKAAAPVEFGAKIVVSKIDGYHFLEELSWDGFNEATRLKEQIERYRDRFHCYPEAVLADKLYRTRDNIQFCWEHRIRLSGPRLGRTAKDSRTIRKWKRRIAGCATGSRARSA